MLVLWVTVKWLIQHKNALDPFTLDSWDLRSIKLIKFAPFLRKEQIWIIGTQNASPYMMKESTGNLCYDQMKKKFYFVTPFTSRHTTAM